MNFERFLHIISKWPAESGRKNLDYGSYLRDLVKKKDINGNVFPGNSMENSKKLDALLRLLNNTYLNKYPCARKKGGSGLDLRTVNLLLNSETSEEKPIIFISDIKNEDKQNAQPETKS